MEVVSSNSVSLVAIVEEVLYLFFQLLSLLTALVSKIWMR